MRILVQRVRKARVTVNEEMIARIGKGLVLFVGVGREERDDEISRLASKVRRLRIFEDDRGKMNLDIEQAQGEILSVSQFTLYADTRKGNRPGFDQSAEPRSAERYWNDFNNELRGSGITVHEGVFGAHMQVELINDGPVTIWLDSEALRKK